VQSYFGELADFLQTALRGDEVYTASYHAEESDFARLSGSRVRQAGSVSQKSLSLDLIEGRRHASASIGLSGDLELDRDRLGRHVTRLREQRAALPEDPLLLYATDVQSTERAGPDPLPDPDEVLGRVLDVGRGRDLVGVYAAGGMHAGFANSLGQRNWESSYSFNLDWSFYLQGDKAAKASYAGFEWEPSELERRANAAVDQLQVLGRTPRTIEPGAYRVYLAPAALAEIVDMLRWGGFGLRAHRTKSTPLLRMLDGDEQLHPSVTMIENTRGGLGPGFENAGFLKPPEVTLIRGGVYSDALVSPRSSVEYGVPTNGASGMEAPVSIELGPGALAADRVLAELGTGVFVSNLWYLNYSDRSACRTTGMTRFATFWVEGGQIQAPLSVMRFDETVYRMLGKNLAGLTAERELLIDPGSYGRRSSASAHLPGALVDDFVFTL
jgi:predicted Zn-dependent protease